MSLWQVDGDWDPVPEQEIDDLTVEGVDELNMSFDYLISKSPAYEWLLARVHKAIVLQPADPDRMAEVRKKIIECLPTLYVISRKHAPQGVKANFELNWDPIAFIREQEYSENPHEEIGRVITVTGHPNDAQATTCADYLSQTWPLVGEHVLHLIKLVMRSPPGHRVQCKCQDTLSLPLHIYLFSH
jgi:hypothetical protein